MKTKLIRIASQEALLAEIDRSVIPTAQDVEARARKQLTEGRLYFGPAEDGKPADKGSRVTLRISSSLPKYNREKVALVVGKGIYNPAIEAELVGMRAGESGETTVQGEPVSYTLLKIERLVCPEPTDEMARGKGIDGVYTVEQYKTYILDQERRAVIRAIADSLLTRLIESSEFAMDAADIRNAVRMQYGKLRDRFMQSGTDLDALPDEEWKQTFYHPEQKENYEIIYPFLAKACLSENRQAYLNILEPDAVRSIQRAAVLCPILGKENAEEFDPTLKADAEQALVEAYYEMIGNRLIGEE